MDNTIGSLTSSEIIVVDADDRIDKVVEILDFHKLSCVPVVDIEGECFGVISAPDLVHFQKMNLNPRAQLAWEFCTHNIIEVSSDLSIRETAKLMIKNKIHHIIVSDNKILKGIVSSIDIIESMLTEEGSGEFKF